MPSQPPRRDVPRIDPNAPTLGPPASSSGDDDLPETLPPPAHMARGAVVVIDEPAPLEEHGSARYLEMELLGRGGMGEVHLCTDVRIGRDVAMKRARPPSDPGG